MFLFWLLVPPLCLVALSLPSSSFYTYILSPSSLLASTPSSTMAPLKVRARIATPMQSARAVLLLACVVASPGVFVLAPRHQKAIFHFSNPIPNSAQCSAVGKKQVKISVPYGAFVYVSIFRARRICAQVFAVLYGGAGLSFTLPAVRPMLCHGVLRCRLGVLLLLLAVSGSQLTSP